MPNYGAIQHGKVSLAEECSPVTPLPGLDFEQPTMVVLIV